MTVGGGVAPAGCSARPAEDGDEEKARMLGRWAAAHWVRPGPQMGSGRFREGLAGRRCGEEAREHGATWRNAVGCGGGWEVRWRERVG